MDMLPWRQSHLPNQVMTRFGAILAHGIMDVGSLRNLLGMT